MATLLDLSRLRPEARQVAERAATVYLKHTAPWFIGLVSHGSAVKGGIIPGCSDIDFQLYLEDAAFAEDGYLPLEVSIAIHRDLAHIDPSPFSYIQCYAFSSKRTEKTQDWVGPVPGAYHLIAGRLPLPEATAEQLRASAVVSLANLVPALPHLRDGLLDHGGGRLERNVRLLCTEVWPVLFQILALGQGDPIRAWNLNKVEAMSALPNDFAPGRAIRRFYDALLAYYPSQDSVERGLAVIEHGVAFREAAKTWWEQSGVPTRLELTDEQ